MKMIRALQREMLEHLRDHYPNESSDVLSLGDPKYCAGNLYYLRELGLVRLVEGQFMDGTRHLSSATITAKGIDFIEDDGGVSALLGTVTIKLHEDTLRRLIESKVKASDAPEDQKTGLLQAIREAPGDAIKHLTEKLLDLGLENAPKAIPLIQTLLQSGHS